MAWANTLRAEPMSLVLPFLAFMLGIFPIILSSYHQFLLCNNHTTNENCKSSFKATGNPYEPISRWQHIKEVFCLRFNKNWNPQDIVATRALTLLQDRGGTVFDFNQKDRKVTQRVNILSTP